MPPLPFNREAGVLAAAAKRIGLHAFPIPMAINSVPYQGRPGCIACPHCVGFACEVNAKNSTAVSTIHRAIATKHCGLRTGCVPSRIVMDAGSKASGIEYFQDDKLLDRKS